jgi:hypothetical protein
LGPKAARVSAAVHAEMSLVLADFHTSMSSGPLPGLACTAPMTADPTACDAVAGDAGPVASARPAAAQSACRRDGTAARWAASRRGGPSPADSLTTLRCDCRPCGGRSGHRLSASIVPLPAGARSAQSRTCRQFCFMRPSKKIPDTAPRLTVLPPQGRTYNTSASTFCRGRYRGLSSGDR